MRRDLSRLTANVLYGEVGETAWDGKNYRYVESVADHHGPLLPAVITSANPQEGDRCACRRYVRFRYVWKNALGAALPLGYTAGPTRVKLPMSSRQVSKSGFVGGWRLVAGAGTGGELRAGFA